MLMKKYIGCVLTELTLVGAADVELSPVESTVNYEYIYIGVDDKYLKFSAVTQMSELKVNEENEINFDFEIDEDDKYFSVSITDLILLDTISEVSISEIEEYTDEGKLKAIGITLENSQIIFIDATYYTGLKLGGAQVKNAFLDNFPG